MLIVTAVSATALSIAAPPSGGGRLVQCWTDAHGVRSCSDVLPPSAAGREREYLNSRGVVTRVVPSAEGQAKLAGEATARADAEQRAKYDRFLIETYRTPGDIAHARDERLAALDDRLTLSRKSLADCEASLADLRRRDPDPDDPEAAPQLARQVRSYQKACADNRRSIDDLQAERARTEAQFDGDLTRYRQLRGAATGP